MPLPLLHGVDDGRRLSVGVHPQEPSREWRLMPRGTTQRVARPALVEDAGEGALEDRPVVHAGADHDLTVDLDTVVEEGTQPT